MPRDENRPTSPAVPRRRASRYTNDPVSLGLRKLWQNVEQEPVPADFLDLLDAIDAATGDEPSAPAAGPGNDRSGKSQ